MPSGQTREPACHSRRGASRSPYPIEEGTPKAEKRLASVAARALLVGSGLNNSVFQ